MIGDAKSRDLILGDFRNTLFVEAGAGSGKTTAMVARIMALVIDGLADIREVVAITFTNEGAASLKSKILHELEKASAEKAYAAQGGATLRMLAGGELDRIQLALEYLPLAHVSTIHSFCLSMLKERPVEAGIDPQFDMNTEGNIPSPFNAAWLKFLLECARNGHPFIHFMLQNGIELNDVAKVARLRSENPDLVLYTRPTGPVSDKTIETAFKRASTILSDMHHRIDLIEHERESGEKDKRLKFVREAYGRMLECDGIEKKRAFLSTLKVYDRWNKTLAFFEQQSSALGGLCDRIRKEGDDHLHSHIATFVEEFMVWFTRHKKTTSSLYFDDLLFLTREMLRTSREVREYFKNRFKYLFIDETQDTDPLQTEIVFFLCEKPEAFAKRWQDVTLHPSKLFMVGDPKQSIYKFRRADITMYEEARERIAGQGGKVLTLEKNFRSGKEIINFVNDHFEGSFKDFAEEQKLKLQPEYVRLVEGATQPSHLPKHILALVSEGEKRDYLGDEAAKIIDVINGVTGEGGPQIVDAATGTKRNVRLSDIMILLRSMTDVEFYERMLEESDIPHYQVGGKTFFATEDIRGLAFALQAVDDPTDTISLFGALRSPVFGLSDQSLLDHVTEGGTLSVFSSVIGEPVGPALLLLKSLHHNRERLRPSGVVKELFNASGMCHVVMMERNGVQKSSRYFRFLELVYELERDRTRSFRSVVEALREVMEMDDPQLANVTIAKPAENAVKITTIHRAKGLESPVVILANGNRRSRVTEPSFFVLRDEGKIVIPYSYGGFYDRDREALVTLEVHREKCEEERLRYVAATRARDLLVLCVPAEKEEKTFNGKFAGSLKINPLVGDVHTFQKRGKVQRSRKVASNLHAVYTQTRQAQQLARERLISLVEGFVPRFVSVHDMMETDESLFTVRRKSYGKGFGNVLHRIMQHYLTNVAFEVESIVDIWMEEERVPRRHREDLLGAFARLKLNHHVQEALTATARHVEWEFFVTQDQKILAGVIDLVYRNRNGRWVIVDYKTDDVSDPDRKQKLDDLYGGQLQLYAGAFEKITGESVGETALLYAGET